MGSLSEGATAPLRALRTTARHPRLLRLQLAGGAVLMASWTATVALTVVAYDEGGTAAVAYAAFARTLPAAFAGPLLGVVVDRTSRRGCLLWAAVTGAAGSAGAAAAGSSLLPLVLLIVVVALATLVFRTALSAHLPDVVEDAGDLTAANVLASGVEALGVFAGPALAGLMLSTSGPGAAFGVAAGLFAAGAALLAGRPSRRRAVDVHARALPPARSRELLRMPATRLLLAVVLAQTVLNGGLVVLYPSLAVESLDAGLEAVGLLLAAFGMGGLIGSMGLFALAGSRRLGRLTVLALLLWSVPLLLVPALPELTPVLVLLAVVGAANALFDVTCVTLLQRSVPTRLLGRVFGLLETVIVLGLGAGAALAGVAEGPLSPAATIAVLAAPVALVALLAARPLLALDLSLAAPAEQVALLRGLAPFGLLATVDVERLALLLTEVDVADGEVVVRQGEPGSTYYVVQDGELAVTVDGEVVGVLQRGGAFGEIALLAGGVRTATVTARTPAVLLALEGQVFLAALAAGGGSGATAARGVALAHLQRAAPAGTRAGLIQDRPPLGRH